MYHFFVPQNQIGLEHIAITGPDVNHIKNVLRMKPGEELMIGNGQDTDYHCRIVELGPDAVKAKILKASGLRAELPARLYLFQGLPKQEKMEWIIQKAVELGVYEVVPVAARRSVVKLDEKKAQAKGKRWNSIAEAGAKQSGRGMIPKVAPVMGVKEALEYAKGCDVKLLPYEKARGMAGTKAAIGQVKPGIQTAVFIGPEGGFEEGEVSQAVAAGFQPISLGGRILRTETAGMAVLSLLMYQLETWGQ